MPTCSMISSSSAFKAIPAAVPLLASAINYRATGSYVNRSVRRPWRSGNAWLPSEPVSDKTRLFPFFRQSTIRLQQRSASGP